MTPPREAKPEWAEVPASIKQQLEDRLGSVILSAEIAWGGYSPSASYIARLQDGRRVFIKGMHPGQSDSGGEDFTAELTAYKTHPELSAIAPRLLASAEEGNWHLMALEAIEGGSKLLPWDEAKLRSAFASINQLREIIPQQTSDLHSLTASPLLASLTTGSRGWCALDKDKVYALLNESDKTLLVKLMPQLLELETKVHQLGGRQQVLHVDIRSDNMLMRADGCMVLLDWPNICWGPLVYDVVAFINTVVPETGWPHERILALAEEVLGEKFMLADLRICAANLSGYFAGAGIKSDVPALPRLRSYQRAQFLTLLPWLELLLEMPKKP